MKKILALLLIVTQTAWAGLPPTSTQGQSDATPLTKFNFQVPNNTMTDLGGVKALLETGNKNILNNASFEDNGVGGGYSHFWAITKLSGTSFGCGRDQTNYADGKQSAGCTTTSATGELSEDINPTIQTNGVPMVAACRVKTTATDVQVCARTSDVDVSCSTVSSNGNWVLQPVNFTGPANGQDVGVSVKNTVSGSESFNVDDCYVGVASTPQNFGQVSQAQLYGTIKITGCSGAWSTSSTTIGALTNPSSCVYTTTGFAQAPSANTLGIKFAQLPPGEYAIQYDGLLQGSSTANFTAVFYDGTNYAREYTSYSVTAGGFVPGINNSISYTTAQSNITFQIYGVVQGSGTMSVYGTNGFPGVIKVWRYPTSSEIAWRPDMQVTPTIQKFTSGSGTYTTPAGVTWIRVRMVGGGGGGGGTSAGAGAGGNTTFGSSLLTANGGGAGANAGNGGTGGTATIAAPAVGTAIQGGNGGSLGDQPAQTSWFHAGGNGCTSPFGGAGSGAAGNGNGSSAVANTGSGGGGSGSGSNQLASSGGGCGGYIDAVIVAPSATYSYSVGSSGTAGPGTLTGGAGGSGYIIVEEYYKGMNAPLLMGSVTSNSTGQEHAERALVGSGTIGSPNTCSTATCTILKQSGSWLTSVTRQSAGNYTLNITSGEFSDVPSCTCSANGNGADTYCEMYWGTGSATSTSVQIHSSADIGFSVICMGPH